MKKITLSLLSLLILALSGQAQKIVRGQIALGGTNSDEVTSIVQTKNGGYAIAGVTSSYGSGYYQVYVANFDKGGLLKWAKAIGGTGLDYGYSIVQAPDGGFAVTGYTNSFASGTEDVYVIKLDSLGNKKWTESIGGNGSEQGKCIINTKDGGFAIGGYTSSFGSGGPGDFYVIKMTTTGTIQWTKTIGGSADEEAYTIIQCKDGGYALTGYTLSYGAGNADVYIVKLDSLGALKWTRTVGGPLGDAGWGICQTYDGGYAVTGYEAETAFGAGSDDVYVIKLDALGNVKWTKTIGGTGNDQGQAIVETKDRGLAIAGFTASFGAGAFDVYLVKLDSLGNKIWDVAAGGAGNDVGSALVKTSDGGFAVAGYTDNYGGGSEDAYIVKFDSNGVTCGVTENAGGVVGTGGTYGSGGNVSFGGSINFKDSGRIVEGGAIDTVCRTLAKSTGIENIQADLSQVNIYPNPCNSRMNIDFGNQSGLMGSVVSITVTDITGRIILSSNIENPTYTTSFDVTTLSPGMYFMRISSGQVSEVKKFIKE